MKQTKKLTRSQREYLQRHGIETEGCRLVIETRDYIEYQTPDGSVNKIHKGDESYE